MGPHPKNLILLCCDAFGVLPPVSRLTKEQAMYYFISGYTAKVRLLVVSRHVDKDQMGARSKASASKLIMLLVPL